MVTNRNTLEMKSYFLRLIIILLVFPIGLVYAVPSLEGVQQFYAGNRSHWFDFWLIAAALEWLTLFAVIATVHHKRPYLEAIGFPVNLSRRELIVGISILLANTVLAFLGAGGPQSFLQQLPAGLQMFIPPSELGARLFWVFVSLTAAICEETLWRGFAITELRVKTGSTLLAVLISSLAFVFFHGGLQQGTGIFAYRFFISIILSVVYLRSGDLRWPILIHFLMDASALMAIQFD